MTKDVPFRVALLDDGRTCCSRVGMRRLRLPSRSGNGEAHEARRDTRRPRRGDIVDAQIRYHLDAGVDFVIATDHESRDGTTEILESYVRDGSLRRIAVSGEMHDGPWRTTMARLAATDHEADWVINTDADEFWMPCRGTLDDVFDAVPEPYGIVFALSRHFAPCVDDGTFFAERMTVRVSPPVAINDPTSPYRPHLKVAHRADPGITVGHGAHTASSDSLRALHHWHPAEVFHFPFRSLAQWESKGVRRARGDSRLGQYVAALLASESRTQRRAVCRARGGRRDLGARPRRWVARRRRSAARRPSRRRLERWDVGAPSVDRGLIAESDGVRDADTVRLNRFLDGLNARVGALEA